MARRDTNSDTGRSARNRSRESAMHDIPERMFRSSVQDDAELGGLAATRGAADIPQSPKRR